MKTKIFFASLIFKCLSIAITFLVLFSSCTKDENAPTPPPAPKWKTIFFDDFNRANTDNGDLGSNWTVHNTSGGSIMQIINNEIYAVEVRVLGAPPKCPFALNAQDLNYSNMRISVKMRTDSFTNSTLFVLFARADTNLSNGYFIGYDGHFFQEKPNAVHYGYVGDLSANTTYLLEIITDNNGFEATIKDYYTGSQFGWGYILDEDLNAGKVGFKAGAFSPNAVYVEDFKIEILE